MTVCEDTYSAKCPACEFFSLPTIADLARIIDLLTSHIKTGDTTGGEENFVNLVKMVKLDASIQPTSKYEFKEPKVVLLAGTTN